MMLMPVRAATCWTRGMLRPIPTTVGSAMVATPRLASALSLAAAAPTCSSSSQSAA